MTKKKKTQSPQNIYYKIICAIREREKTIECLHSCWGDDNANIGALIVLI